MATASLKGLWGLEQIDHSGWSNRKISGAFALSGILLSLSVSTISHFFGTQIPFTNLLYNFLIAISLIYFSTTVVLARLTEQDYQSLISVDPRISESIHKSPPRRLLLFTCFTSISLMFAIDVWLLGGNSSLSFGVDGVITWLLMVALNGYALGLLLTSQIHLSRVMCHTVRTLSFNLSQLADLQPASMPLVRLFAVISLFVSSWTFSVEIGGFPIAIYFLITPISLTVLYLYFLPVLLLRGRIKEKKEAALKKNLEMLAELDRQDEHEIIGHSAMLTQQMFIESRGEWPVAPHLQKLILFGLLPPLSWVMAAKIESLVS